MSEWTTNPYVIQMDKFVNSLEKLSNVFLRLDEETEEDEREEAEELYQRVRESVCIQCRNCRICSQKDGFLIRPMMHEIFYAVEDYGAELHIELKRSIQSRCVQAPRFLRACLETFREVKQSKVWNQKMIQSREGCAVQLDAFAQMIQHATRELDASIFSDEHLEKKLKTRFAKHGLKLLSTVFFITEDGRYEIHVTAKVVKGQCVSTKEVVELVSGCVGRRMVLSHDERPVLGGEYSTLVCVEGMRYHTLQGVARIGKGCEKISGDSFSMIEMQDGKRGMILSDGMGAGERAYRESALVVEMLEELLDAGFPKETALQMLNTALVMGREEVRFSTIDMSVFDLYTGKCEIVKAGASMTFIKRQTGVDIVKSESLPIGVVPKLSPDCIEITLSPGDVVIMVTDGVLDALPVGEAEMLLGKIIEGTQMTNVKELAHHILEQVLACSGEVPLDDMTILAAGIWSLEK